MIRKSTVSLDFANTGKKKQLHDILHEYNKAVNIFIDYLWNQNQFTGSFVSSTNWVDAELSAALKQCAAKQALSTVKSQRKKKLKTKPSFNALTMELDSRIVKFAFDENSFDIWITLAGLNRQHGLKIALPSRKHVQFNKFKDWNLKKSMKVREVKGKLYADLYFEKDFSPNLNCKTKAFNIGYKKLLVDSDNNRFGTEFEGLCTKISRKRQGSKAFKRSLRERDAFVNSTIKAAGIEACSTVVIEALKDVKKNSRKQRRICKAFMNKLQRWTYSKIVSRIKLTSEELGVQVIEVNPRNTSRTCPACGHVDKLSRDKEVFTCTACSYCNDADYVGALNILALA